MFDSRPKPLMAQLSGHWGVVGEEHAHSVNLHFRLIWSYDSQLHFNLSFGLFLFHRLLAAWGIPYQNGFQMQLIFDEFSQSPFNKAETYEAQH